MKYSILGLSFWSGKGLRFFDLVEGDGAVDREKRGREAGFPRWWEAGEKGENEATLYNTLQLKKCKEVEPTNTGLELGSKGSGIKGKWEV